MKKIALNLTCCSILVAFCYINPTVVNAKILRVPADHPTIQAAIDTADNGDTVLVADGIYIAEGNVNLNFGGKSITVKSENGPDNCIIMCAGNSRGFSFENGETKDAVVDGFTIIKGSAGFGGGVYCKDASPTIRNNIITECVATGGRGGGIYSEGGSPTITNNIITNNSASPTSNSWGGGICSGGGSPTINNNIITNNSVSATNIRSSRSNPLDQALGGGVYYSSGSLINNTIINNSVSAPDVARGGGVFLDGATTTSLENSIVRKNTPDSVAGSGAVIYSNIEGGWNSGFGIIDADALFVNPNKGDYHLKPDSPGIDAGNPGAEHNDLDGSRNDMGAYGGPLGDWKRRVGDSGQDCLKGDVNGDGLIKSIDASLALRMAAGLLASPSEEQQCAADMNNDGLIKSIDASLILRKAAGLDVPAAARLTFLPSPLAKGGQRGVLNRQPSTIRTLTIRSVTGQQGDTLTLPITLDDATGVLAADLSLTYDSDILAFVEATTSHFRVEVNAQDAGKVIIPLAAQQPLENSDGLLVQLTFQIRDTANVGSESPLQLTEVLLWDVNAQPISVSVQVLPIQLRPIPKSTRLLPNYPNPFNPETWIPYQLATDAEVTMTIYNLQGETVHRLDVGYRPAGHYENRGHAAYWNGRTDLGEHVASGVYFVKMQAGEYSAVRRLVVIK